MFRPLFLAFGILLAASPVWGQHSLYVGVRGGYHASTANLSHTILATPVPTTQLLSGSGGIMVKYFVKPHFGLQWELNYTRKGFEQLLFDTNDVFKTTFDYLEFPFMFNIYLGKRKTQYFANFGPFIAVLTDHKITGPDNSTSDQLDFLFDSGRDKKSATGIKFAGGIFREFSFGGLQVDGFFTADISNFLNPVDLSTGVPDNSQNLVFGISVAYLVPLGKNFNTLNK